MTDAELLARYARGRDEAAFAAVVQRYGGLVLAVARRQLADPQQAEGVFQATFLALARSAERLSRAAPLANWLYTVAVRTARKARVREARRRDHEKAGAAPTAPPADPLAEISGRELLRAVDEELARLPEKYRLPVLLCCVQGLSREEAARQLGWSAGALKGRLERGLRVVLTGYDAERELTSAVARAMRAPALDLAGRTTLGSLGALLHGARLLVSNDTGVARVAAALRLPSVVLIHSPQVERWAPLDRARHRPVPQAAEPAAVLREADEVLSGMCR